MFEQLLLGFLLLPTFGFAQDATQTLAPSQDVQPVPQAAQTAPAQVQAVAPVQQPSQPQAAPSPQPTPVIIVPPPGAPQTTQPAPTQPLVVVVPAQPTPAPEVQRTPAHIAVGIFATAQQTAKFDNAYVSTTGASGYVEIEAKIDSAVGLTLSYRDIDSLHSWGFEAGAEVQNRQSMKTMTISGPGGSITGLVEDTKFRSNLVFGNAIYRWETVYLPFGLNYSFPEMSNLGHGEISGGVGVQIGVGFQASENCAIELNAYATSLKIKGSDSTSSLDSGDGTVSSARVGLKIGF